MSEGGFPEGRLEFAIFDWVEDSGREPWQIFEHKLQMVEAADKAGFYGFHLAEHTGTPLSLDGSPSVLLAAAIERSSQIRLGALTFCLPWQHPYRFYNEICMLDHLSRGRIELGVGRGVSAIESAYYGLGSIEASRDRYRETLDIFMQACQTHTLNYEGKHFAFKDLELFNRPYQRPYPPLWFPSSNRDSVAFTASHGYSTVFNFDSAAEVRALCNHYREVWVAHKDDKGRHNGHVARPWLGKRHHVVIADTDSEAEAIAAPAFKVWRDHIGYLTARADRQAPGSGAVADPVVSRVSRDGGLLAGTAKTVAAELADYIEASSINYALVTFSFGDLRPEHAMRSLELFAKEVIPAVRGTD